MISLDLADTNAQINVSFFKIAFMLKDQSILNQIRDKNQNDLNQAKYLFDLSQYRLCSIPQSKRNLQLNNTIKYQCFCGKYRRHAADIYRHCRIEHSNYKQKKRSFFLIYLQHLDKNEFIGKFVDEKFILQNDRHKFDLKGKAQQVQYLSQAQCLLQKQKFRLDKKQIGQLNINKNLSNYSNSSSLSYSSNPSNQSNSANQFFSKNQFGSLNKQNKKTSHTNLKQKKVQQQFVDYYLKKKKYSRLDQRQRQIICQCMCGSIFNNLTSLKAHLKIIWQRQKINQQKIYLKYFKHLYQSKYLIRPYFQHQLSFIERISSSIVIYPSTQRNNQNIESQIKINEDAILHKKSQSIQDKMTQSQSQINQLILQYKFDN